MKRKDHVKMHSYPGMVAVVGVYSEGQVNFMAAGWHSYVSMDPAMYGVAIGRGRHTYKMVKQAEMFSINFLPCDEAPFIQYSGSVSGNDVSKVDNFGQKWRLEQDIYPVLSEAYLAYECEVQQIVPTGDHDWVIGDITSCFYDEKYFGEDGLPNFEQLNIPLYLGRSTYLKLDEKVERKEIRDPLSHKKS